MSDETPENDERKQPHVFTEEAKQRQVSHWDLDYLPTEAVEEAYDDEPEPPPQPGPTGPIQVADDYAFIPKDEYDKTAAKKAHKTDD